MDKIIELANQLIQELINQGYDIRGVGEKGILPGYLSFNVIVFDAGGINQLYVSNIGQGWEICGTCTAKYPEHYLK